MLVVISDLHFQDTRNDDVKDVKNGVIVNVDRNVPADAFYLVFEDLFKVAAAKGAKEIIVVLAGDIFDLNRSSRWQQTNCRPYDDAASPSTWGPVAIAIFEDIIRSNMETFDVLKSLLNPQSYIASELNQPSIPFRFEYIPGNHDRIVNLYPPLSQRIRELFGLSNTGKFCHELCKDEYGVHIRHGHEFDKHNFAGDIPEDDVFRVADKDYDLAPLGDYVTIEFAAGWAYQYKISYLNEMQSGNKTFQDIYRRLLEFDDLRPQSDLIDFIDNAWDSLAPVADKVVERALDSKFLRSKIGVWGKILPLLKVLPTKLLPTKFIIKSISGMKSEGPDIWQFAKREPALNLHPDDSAFLYAVSGHTHNPDVEFLLSRQIGQNDRECFFFDTGTWRQQIRKCCGEKTFSKAKALTYVVFYGPDENIPVGARTGRLGFDYWSGFQKRM